MNRVERIRGFRKIIRVALLRGTVQKYVTAGNKACGRMMREARSRQRNPGPSDKAILAWAEYDLSREIRNGFWEMRTA